MFQCHRYEHKCHKRGPLKLFVEFAVYVELNISNRPPLNPMKTPNDFFVVIRSFSMMAASSNTKIGTVVAMIDALMGEELFSPTTNSHWLIPAPQRAQTRSITESFSNTFFFGMKKDMSQNIMQATPGPHDGDCFRRNIRC